MTTGGPNIRRQPGQDPQEGEPRTGIIRRHSTGSFPQQSAPPPSNPAGSSASTQLIDTQREDPATRIVAAPTIAAVDESPTSYLPRARPQPIGTASAARHRPAAAAATATVAILGGWATAVIATSLISNWWDTDQLFCIAIGFLTAVSAGATIGGLIVLLLHRRMGRLLIVVGAVVSLMIFAGLFVAGAELPPIIYGIPVLPIGAVALASLPATGRWCD